MRSSSQLLGKVIDADIRTVIYDGDADYICNYRGIENMINFLSNKCQTKYLSTPWTSWTVDGVATGQFKSAGNVSNVRISQCVCHPKSRIGIHLDSSRSGHMVAAYTIGNLPYGKHALTMYNQAMAGKPISSM